MNCPRTILLLVLASAVWIGAPAAPAAAKNIGDSLMVITTDENGVPIVGGGGGGDASAANQVTQTGLLTTIDADTGNIATSTSTTATNTGTIAGAVKAEDAAHSSGHTGIPFWGVRNDSAATSLTDTNGDYTPIATDSNGRLFINAISSIFSVTPGTSATALGKAEDAAHTSGDSGVMVLCVRQDTAAALATTVGDYIPCATDATGRMWTNTELPDAADLADTTANPTVPGVGSYNMCWNGSTWDRCVKASAGAGNSDSATQRVVIARDSDVCNPKDTSQVVISTASSGNVELVALTSGQTIYLCDFTIMSGGTVGVQLIYGTGTACATGETNMTGVMPLVVNTGWTHNYGGRLKTAEANAFCIELSGAVQVDGVATYRKMGTF